jgi:hypothetical protein
LRSHNPLWANVHVYWSVFRDACRARRWRDKLQIWFRAPAWRPEGLERSHPVDRPPLEDFRKWEPEVSGPHRAYAFFQFFCTTLATTGLLVVASKWDSTPLFLAVGMLCFSFYLQGAWTEGRSYAPWLEWLKLGLIFVVLPYLPMNATAQITIQAYVLLSALFLMAVTIRKTRQRPLAVNSSHVDES